MRRAAHKTFFMGTHHVVIEPVDRAHVAEGVAVSCQQDATRQNGTDGQLGNFRLFRTRRYHTQIVQRLPIVISIFSFESLFQPFLSLLHFLRNQERGERITLAGTDAQLYAICTGIIKHRIQQPRNIPLILFGAPRCQRSTGYGYIPRVIIAKFSGSYLYCHMPAVLFSVTVPASPYLPYGPPSRVCTKWTLPSPSTSLRLLSVISTTVPI